MLDSFRMIYQLLDAHERKRFFVLIAMTLVMGFLDVLGVASILPFLAVVSNPEVVETNAWLADLRDLSGLEDRQDFMILLGVLVFLFVVVSTAIKALTFYALTRFTRMRTLSLATRLMRHYLAQPYVWFLTRHSADLGKTVLSEVAQVVNGPISAAMRFIAQAVVVAFLVGFLLLLEPAAALGAAILFGGSYGIVFVIARNKLTRMGEERVEANREKYKIMQEALGGIKNVKLMNLERSYLDRFQDPARRLAQTQAAVALISEMPRHLLEVVAFGGMILFVLWLIMTGSGDVSGIVPILGVYAVAAARMFPAIQQLFTSLSALRFGQPALEALHAELVGSVPQGFGSGRGKPIPLRRELALEHVSFAFPNANRPALDDLSMTIEANSTVGLVGATGAGKTTAVDLILGLLSPQSGNLKVDGQVIDPKNIRAWQRSVGYVPQDIFLVDDSVAANIAFGVPEDQIDREAVERAARVAELHDFVTGQLPQGYDTLVGERGARLSGGQRQRIGIARALYNDPDVLIFDEATSALDNLTERAVMDAVRSMSGRKTIVLIAHRLSTVRNCDKIFVLDRGRLSSADTYDRLVENDERFRALHEATA